MGALDRLLRDALGAGAGAQSQGFALLARMLPLVIDRLTPQGQVPRQDPLTELGGR